MALADEDFRDIEAYIRERLPAWLAQAQATPAYDRELYDRVVRVEEELRHQRELMQKGFENTDKRFAELREDMDKRFAEQREDMEKRFEAVDRRFEAVDRRFEAMDQRFTELREDMEKRFAEQREDMEKRFEAVDKRFEAMDQRFEELRRDMDKRFEAVESRLERLETRMDRFMLWSFGSLVTVGALIVGILKVWPPGG